MRKITKYIILFRTQFSSFNKFYRKIGNKIFPITDILHEFIPKKKNRNLKKQKSIYIFFKNLYINKIKIITKKKKNIKINITNIKKKKY